MIIVQPGQGGELFPPLSQIGCRLHPLPPLWQALVASIDEVAVPERLEMDKEMSIALRLGDKRRYVSFQSWRVAKL